MKPGNKERYDCVDCGTEFEVIYEPKATALTSGIEDKEIDYCPFCGEMINIDEEDEEDEE